MAHLAPRDIAAVVVGLGAIFSWTLGLLTGFILGKKIKMTKKEAARVMGKASWKNRVSPKPQNHFVERPVRKMGNLRPEELVPSRCTRPVMHVGPCNGLPRYTCLGNLS